MPLQPGEVKTTHIADEAVTTAKIKDSAVTPAYFDMYLDIQVSKHQ